MGFGVSIFLITVGAVFKWAITAHISGVDLRALGVIFMVIGAASFILQIALMSRQPRSTRPEMYRDERGGNAPGNPE